MPDTLELEIATPERLLVREQTTEVQVPAKDGYLGILPGHAPLLSELGTGFLSYIVGGQKRYMSLQGGFVEVLPGNVRVLANAAVPADEIDVEAARRDLQKANEEVVNSGAGVDPAIALDELAWAQARVDAAAKDK
jgi:F-type H+-transporting ATPase subunit epsilon